DIISVHISSHLSGTVQSAKLASQMFPEHRIFVIDSKLASMGMGLVVLEAARAIAAGKSLEEVLNIVHSTITKCKVFFFVDSLKYLQQGGRIGKANALLGTMLSIKPILRLNDGIIEPYEKVRGRSKALERLAQIFQEKTTGKRVNYCLLHGNDQQGLETLLHSIVPTMPFGPPIISRVGPVVGTHVGPGVVGLTFIEY
ncbi:MAG: DegV family protein, partial [Peptococcaceae bacterium]|nr:DegV family protein [Peptococcaceae bacterium]